MKSLQETHAPNSICFGCGPANAKGLRIRSFAMPDGSVEAEFQPESHHEAFPGMLNGGIIGSLLDCHSNWTAAYSLMKQAGLSEPPCTVTAEFQVKLRAPTPSGAPVRLVARVKEIGPDRAVISAELFSRANPTGKPTASCIGTFVAVKEGHPAFHRWG
jgi:acyl-coenzyme A thioesterase PaaI-like protein